MNDGIRRLFVAIELGQEVRSGIEAALVPARAEAPELSWTAPARQHLTVKFLGDVDSEQARMVCSALDLVASRHRPISMRLTGFGAFPNFRRARVVWLGVEQEARLELLHHDVELACAAVGFEVEARAFRPHITVARVRSALEPERMKRLSRLLKRAAVDMAEAVGSLVLFESVLTQPGAEYTQVHVSALRGS